MKLVRVLLSMMLGMPLSTQAQPAALEEPIVEQFIAAVGRNSQQYSTTELGKFAVVSGFAVSLKPGIRDVQATTAIINRCWAAAASSEQMRNLMACYIMDRKVTNIVDRITHAGVGQFTQQNFNSTLDALGMNSATRSLIHQDFESEWQAAETWLASRTVGQVSDCMKSLQAPECR